MSDVTNLNRFRKSRAHKEKRRQAAENRARYGRSKAEKLISNLNKARAHDHIEGHKLDNNDE